MARVKQINGLRLDETKVFLLAIVLFAIASLAFVNLIDFNYILAADIGLLIILFFYKYPQIGMYMIAFLYPFWGFLFVWRQIDVPYVDLLALLVFIAMVLRTLICFINNNKKAIALREFSGIFWFALFFIASAFAMANNPEFLPALKYLLRPILFFYICYILLPINIIKSKEIFKRIIQIMVAGGLICGLLGILSVLFGSGNWFERRASPISVFGTNLMGGNQNAVAEIMIITLPLILLLYIFSKKIKQKGLFLLAAGLCIIVLLLTFSRTGWLGLLLLFFIIYFVMLSWHSKAKILKAKNLILIMLIILLVVGFYFLVWDRITEVQYSTASRLMMTEAAIDNFWRSPIIGNGLNQFVPLVGGSFVFVVEFGNPLDAHGFIQKIITESGALGFMTFICLLSYFMREYLVAFWKERKMQNKLVLLTLILLLCGVIFFQMFSTSYFIAKMWLPIGVGLAGVRLYANSQKSKV